MLNALKVRLFSPKSSRFYVAGMLTAFRFGFGGFFYANRPFSAVFFNVAR